MLAQISGFSQLQSADIVRIAQHKSLQQLLAFSKLTQAELLEIRDNITLTEMNFPKLHQLVRLTVRDNGALSNWGAFLALKYVQILVICNNPQLTDQETSDFLKSLHKPPTKLTQECN